MAKHRVHSIEFKRQLVAEYAAGETLHALAKRHDVSRNLIRIWVGKGRWCMDRRLARYFYPVRRISSDGPRRAWLFGSCD